MKQYWKSFNGGVVWDFYRQLKHASSKCALYVFCVGHVSSLSVLTKVKAIAVEALCRVHAIVRIIHQVVCPSNESKSSIKHGTVHIQAVYRSVCQQEISGRHEWMVMYATFLLVISGPHKPVALTKWHDRHCMETRGKQSVWCTHRIKSIRPASDETHAQVQTAQTDLGGLRVQFQEQHWKSHLSWWSKLWLIECVTSQWLKSHLPCNVSGDR